MNAIESHMDRYKNSLRQAPLFRGCAETAIEDLARRVQVRTRSAGAVLVAQAEPGDSLFVIASGSVKVALFGDNGRELTLTHLGVGNFFGEMSLLDQQPRSATVIALENTTVLVLTREAFVEHLRRHPQTALNLLAEQTKRLRRADEIISSLALDDVEERLVRTLERLARDEGETVEAGLLIRRRPTQQDLANMVGSCRETVSRTFTSMVRRGLLVPRGRAVVLTRQLLEQRAA